MLFYQIIVFFWNNNRLLFSAYYLGSIALAGFFFFWNRGISPDFNSLANIRLLNVIFFMFGTLICRQMLYQYYLQKNHNFFAQLPIAQGRMRSYEHLTWFILAAMPYLVLIPVFLAQVYYDGLWSTQQVLGFLCFQTILWLVFANYALCLAMLGRLCWYLFTLVLIGFNLYVHYSNDYQLTVLGFFEVNRILYQNNPVSVPFAVQYCGIAIAFYSAARLLSYLIDNNQYGWLHRKETGFSRGILLVVVICLIVANVYLQQSFDHAKTKFSGLYVTALSKRDEDSWSSSVQLDATQRKSYHKKISILNADILAFAEYHQIELAPIHYQHHPELEHLKPLHKSVDADSAIEIKFNFEQLNVDFQNLERDVIIYALKILSRGWVEQESALIYLRGLAQHWSQRKNDQRLQQQRIDYLSAYPNFLQNFTEHNWQRLFQNGGPCLFDALAAALIEQQSASMSPSAWRDFIQRGLNLDNTWVSLQVIRYVFISEPSLNQFFDTLFITDDGEQDTAPSPLLIYKLQSEQLFPKIYQLRFISEKPLATAQGLQAHLYQHVLSGTQVDFTALENYPLNPHVLTSGYQAALLLTDKEHASGTLSWFEPNLDCRVFAPWQDIKL